MPWKVFETGTDDKKFCVHKLNDDGSMPTKLKTNEINYTFFAIWNI